MGLSIRRVTHNKFKLLFASLAIMALAVQPMYGFVANRVANAKTTDGPAEIAEFTANSKCVAGKVAIDVTGRSKATSAQASARYSTTIDGEDLSGDWKNIKTGVTAEGTLQSSKGKTDNGTVTFMVPLGTNTDNFYKYTADYNAIDCGPQFGVTTPTNGTTVVQTNERYEISAEVTSTTSTVESVTWKMTGAKKINSTSTTPKFVKVSDTKWAASYETVNIPTGSYTLTFTATDAAGNTAHKKIKNLSLKPDTDGPAISDVKINKTAATTADTCPAVEPFYVSKTIDISAMLQDPSGVSKANFDLANVNSKNCSNGNLGVGKGIAVSEDGMVQTSFNTKTVAEGVYLLKLRAWDAKNNLNSAQVLIQVDNTNPTVTAKVDATTNPTTVSGTVKDTLSGPDYAQYSIGTGVGGEYMYIAGKNFPNNEKLAVDADGNFSGDIDTSGLSDGSYTLRARGFDKAGNKKSGVDVAFTIKTPEASVDDEEDDVEDDTEQPVTQEFPKYDDGKKDKDMVDDDLTDPTTIRPVSANSIFNRNFALNLDASNDGATTDQNEPQTDTLGDSTANTANGEDVKGAADEKAQSGLAWYWWALIVAAVAAIWWWIAAARKRNQDA